MSDGCYWWLIKITVKFNILLIIVIINKLFSCKRDDSGKSLNQILIFVAKEIYEAKS